MELSTRTRRALSTVLAVFLAVESVSAVAAAAATRPVTHALPVEAPAGQVLAAEATVVPADAAADIVASVSVTIPESARRVVRPVDARAPAATPSPARATAARIPVAQARDPLAKAAKADAAKAAKAARARSKASGPVSTAGTSRRHVSGARYSGTNHVWIPELGINRSISYFPCSRTRPPDNYMYRWGCSGTNNVYLMGHASSVMRPLHDAYASGRLHTGMKAYYADGKGRVHVFSVRWWKITRPTTEASWAWASQSVSSMTLQTCVGSNSQYRLMVRLVEVGG